MTQFYSVTLSFETAKSVAFDLNWSVSVLASCEAAALVVAKQIFRKDNSLSFRKLYSWNTQQIRRNN